MAITRFEDLPSTNTSINSEHLNENFDELGVKVGTSVDNNYRTNIIKGKNLFNINDITPNNFLDINTGDISSSTNWSTSNYIEVSSSTSYVLNYVRSGTSNTTICFYDSSKAFISSASTSTLGLPATFTTPSNAKYLRFDYRSADNQTNIQLEKGNQASAFESYVTPSINVDNEEIYNKNMMATLESLKPYILYESSSGVSTGSITLNDSKDNYKYMEAFCERSVMRLSHKFIVRSSNTSTYLLPMVGADSSQLIIRTIGFTLSGTTLTITLNNRTNIATGSTTFTPDANQLNIVMVIGYK